MCPRLGSERRVIGGLLVAARGQDGLLHVGRLTRLDQDGRATEGCEHSVGSLVHRASRTHRCNVFVLNPVSRATSR